MRIILASASPRRKELLSKMGVRFEVCPSNYQETLDENQTPVEVAKQLAQAKALEVANKFPDALVIGSDTIVWVDNKQLGKPKDNEDATAMLKLLAGKSTKVTTSIALVLLARSLKIVKTNTTIVKFKPYNSQNVAKYVQTGDPLDKAGGYGIQSGAASLIDYIDGNYDTVVGLPTDLLARELNLLDIRAKPVAQTLPIKQNDNGPLAANS